MKKFYLVLAFALLAVLIVMGVSYDKTSDKNPLVQVGRINAMPEVVKYNPKKSIMFNEEYDHIRNELMFARIEKLSGKGWVNVREITDKDLIIEIVREMDKMRSKKPEIVKLNDEELKQVEEHSIRIRKPKNSAFRRFVRIDSNYYLGTRILHYKEPGNLMLYKMPDKLVGLLGLKEKGNAISH